MNSTRISRTTSEFQQGATTDYYAYHDSESAAKLSTTVIHALADVMGADVTDTGFQLHDSIDPDALDRIFSDMTGGSSSNPSHLAFTVENYQVTVYSSGQIVITPAAPPAP